MAVGSPQEEEEETRPLRNANAKRQTCETCGEPLERASDGELACKKETCPAQGVVLPRFRLATFEAVERFGQSPTNEGVFGKNLGGTAPKQIFWDIVNMNNKFRINTREGRKELAREIRRLQHLAQPEEDPNIHCTLEMLSQHNRQRLHLNQERYAMLCQFMRPIISSEKYLDLYPEGHMPPSMIRDILDGVLEDVLHLAPIKYSLKAIKRRIK